MCRRLQAMVVPTRSIALLIAGTGLASCFVIRGIEIAPLTRKQSWSSPIPTTTSWRPHHPSTSPLVTSTATTSTQLRLLLDVPDAFFTVTFPVLGLLHSISKNFARVRMEERAWEQRRLEEAARSATERQDPTVTELDVRRREAASEWSAYGVPRMQEEKARRRRRRLEQELGGSGRSPRVQVMEDFYETRNDGAPVDSRMYRMTEEEIEAFELEYGVEYDPYYNDPYAEDELPPGKYDIDRMYGDRMYENGEIFYKDASTKLFYRQGCKPRNLSFWG
jgi:hypothetical protein